MLKPFDRGFNAAILLITSKLYPCGFDVSDNPIDAVSIKRLLTIGRLCVYAHPSDEQHPFFADAEVTRAFRAWYAHVSGDTEKESREAMCRDLEEIYKGHHQLSTWQAYILNVYVYCIYPN